MPAAKSHPVWKAIGLVVAGYIVLRLILNYVEQRNAAAAPNYPTFLGGGGGYVSGTTGPAAVTSPLPPATGAPVSPPPGAQPGPGPAWKRFGSFVPVNNPYLYLGTEPVGGPRTSGPGSLIGMTGPVEYRGEAS